MTGAITAAPMDVAVSDTDVVITFDDRHYRIHGLDKQLKAERLRVRITVARRDLAHIDTLDLYVARLRKTFIREAAAELYVEAETIKRDVGRLLWKLEELQEERIRQGDRCAEPAVPPMTDQQREEALELLGDPKLLERILEDYDRCGLVGEETGKLLTYLAGVSRLLERPLAVLIQSSSAAGKTTLLSATLSFLPPEDQMEYSALTGQALYYMGRTELRHKVLAVAEEEGLAEAAYALKLLQSDGRLTIATAERQRETGRQQTRHYTVEGPVAMLLSTTAERPDAELAGRCLVIHVNEQPQQTAAIHRRQRQAYTLAGSEADREAIRYRHQNAQRLLKPLGVVIPWAEQLSFRTDQTGMRRDHAKYLALIASITLVHQYQRKEVTRPGDGRRSVVATIEDIRWANRLLSDAAGSHLDGLLPQTRQLLVLTSDYLQQRSVAENVPRTKLRFTQRALREALGWSDRPLRRQLARLVELEYVVAYRTGRGNQREYQLLYDGQGHDRQPVLLGLVDPSTLPSAARRTRQNPKRPAESPCSGGKLAPNRHPIRPPFDAHPAACETVVNHNGHK